MHNLLILAVAAFAITLAIVVGNRMSAEAMAVVVGSTTSARMICGIAASIPLSVLILILTSRLGRREEALRAEPQGEARRLDYPPVVVVNPGVQAQDGRCLSEVVDLPHLSEVGDLPPAAPSPPPVLEAAPSHSEGSEGGRVLREVTDLP